MKTSLALALTSALTAAALGLTATASHAVAETRPVVVELFTSQGCSSCPPADAVLTELAKRPDVIALGFHVDYWDRLGWKDPLSTPGSTERQNDYASAFGRREIYTPQLVVDGAKEVVGSHRGEVLQAIAAAMPTAAAPVAFAPDMKSVTVGGGSGAGKVTLVRFVKSRATEVRRGENAGKTAVDVNGVDKLVELGRWNGAAQSFAIEAPDSAHGVAVLVQGEDGKILGAAALSATES
jgi:hypothetical protein